MKQKKSTPRKPSQYNEFVKTEMAKLRAGGNIHPSQALQVVAKAWKEKDQNKINTINQVSSEKSDIIDLSIDNYNHSTNTTQCDLTPINTQNNITQYNSIPSTPLINDVEDNNSNEVIIERPKSLTRIRFFGTTYLWDKITNNVYSDDISSTNNNFTIIGTMQLNETSQPTKIFFT